MNHATKRAILRGLHLILSIPIMGYIYGEPAEVQQYASAVRYAFVPIIILSGFWMYAGVVFALLGVVLWLAAYYLAGIGAAILGQLALFISRQIWLLFQKRRKRITPSTWVTPAE